MDVEESLFIYGFNYYVVISKSSQTRNSRYKRKWHTSQVEKSPNFSVDHVRKLFESVRSFFLFKIFEPRPPESSQVKDWGLGFHGWNSNESLLQRTKLKAVRYISVIFRQWKGNLTQVRFVIRCSYFLPIKTNTSLFLPIIDIYSLVV